MVRAGGPTVPNGVLEYVPILLTNAQASPVQGGTQVQITMNWSTYATYLNAQASNVILFDSSGNPLNSWMQNFVSTSDVADRVWVQLNSTGIPASSSRTIYMGFYSASTNNFSPNGSWGEAPTISGTYGQYDNGAKVFTVYDNFTGPSLSSRWVLQSSGGGSVTVNKGITFSAATGSDYVYIHTPSTLAYPLVVESDMLSASSTSGWSSPGTLVGLSTSTSLGTPCSQPYNGYDYDQWENYVEIDQNSATNCISSSYTGGVNFTPGLWSFTWYATGEEAGTDSVHGLTWTDSAFAIANYYPYLGIYAYFQGTFSAQWARVRITPPNDVGPSVSFGHINVLRSAADGFAFAESPGSSLKVSRAAADSVTFTDAASGTLALGRSIPDSFSYTDSVSRLEAVGRTPQEAFSFSDLPLSLSTFGRGVSDPFTSSDGVVRLVQSGRIVGDSFSFFELVASVTTFARTVSDSFSFTDLAARTVQFGRSIGESFAILDLPSRLLNLTRTAFDTFPFLETPNQLKHFSFLVHDAFTFVESVARELALIRHAVDTFPLTDSLFRTLYFMRSAAERFAFGITTMVLVSLSLAVGDTFRLVDTVLSSLTTVVQTTTTKTPGGGSVGLYNTIIFFFLPLITLLMLLLILLATYLKRRGRNEAKSSLDE